MPEDLRGEGFTRAYGFRPSRRGVNGSVSAWRRCSRDQPGSRAQRLEESATEAESNGRSNSSSKSLRGLCLRTLPTSASHTPLPYTPLPSTPLHTSPKSTTSQDTQATCKPVRVIPDSNIRVQPSALGTGRRSGSSVAVVSDSLTGPVNEAT